MKIFANRPRFWAPLLTRSFCTKTSVNADGQTVKWWHSCVPGLANASRTKVTKEIQGEFLAIDTALASLSEGDLCLILVDQVEEALAHIASRIAQDAH